MGHVCTGMPQGRDSKPVQSSNTMIKLEADIIEEELSGVLGVPCCSTLQRLKNSWRTWGRRKVSHRTTGPYYLLANSSGQRGMLTSHLLSKGFEKEPCLLWHAGQLSSMHHRGHPDWLQYFLLWDCTVCAENAAKGGENFTTHHRSLTLLGLRMLHEKRMEPFWIMTGSYIKKVFQ